MGFSRILRTHRRRLALSQEDLAHKAGVDVRTIGNVEAGRRTPRPSTVTRLADALGLEGGERENFFASAAAQLDRAAPGRPAVAPAQLPAAAPGFTGRTGELAALDAFAEAAAAQPSAPRVVVVSGTAGVGKTSLAVYWAHRAAQRFPDGQLYINLRGFDKDGRVVPPAQAVRGFLDALGVAADRIPTDPDAQVGLYRSLLAGRRVLVTLDNARDADQVRPLLPGSPTALVVVTSRNRLTSLVATEGAHPLILDVLSTVEARELLERRLGTPRVAPGPEADAIIAACARLPLALTVAAARARQAGSPLALIAAELADIGRRLDVLDAGDPVSQVRAVFSWSYRALTPAAARLFRLLGLHPGADASTAAAASLAGIGLPDARHLLDELVRASLLTEHRTDRYTFHDLLRAYAQALAEENDPDHQRREALTRLLDHLTHTAHGANRLVYPTLDAMSLPLTAAAPGTFVETFADDRQAMSWLDVEHPVVLAAARHAADTGFDRHAWQLAWTLDIVLGRLSYRAEREAAWQLGLGAAERLGDLRAQAYAHRSLGRSASVRGDDTAADHHLNSSLDLYARAGDLAGGAYARIALGGHRERQGRLDESVDHDERALAAFRSIRNERGTAMALNNLGWHSMRLGRYEAAVGFCQEAVELSQRLDDVEIAASALDSLGFAHHHLGNHAEATECYRRSIDLYRHMGSRHHHQADAMVHLGDSRLAAGDVDAARAAWQQALDLYTDLDDPDAEKVRAKLDTVAPGSR